jgi:Peptidase A4 family
MVSLILVLPSVPVLALASSTIMHGPAVSDDSVKSTNWSGYAVTGSKGSVSDAKGSWVVPAISGPCPSTNQYSSHWVGIDGYNSGTVEQTGTDSDCQSGAPRYYAWYEFYPKPSFIVSGLAIHPGDVMTADVKYSGGRYVVTIADTTTGQSFSTSAKVKAQASSAEWVTEAPSSSGGVLPLADFGTVSWGVDYTSASSTNYATVGGVTGTIGSFGASVHQITMVTSGGAVKATPSGLTSDGTSFTVTWASSGP